MEVLKEGFVITRKEHQCFACLIKHKKGTEMYSQTHTYDGIQTVYSCRTCNYLMGKYSDMFLDESMYPEGCVREAMSDYKFQTPEQLREMLDNKFEPPVSAK